MTDQVPQTGWNVAPTGPMNWWMLALAVPLWFVQYLLWVPAVLIWRVSVAIIRFALTIGLVGILLLFLPVIGWVILFMWLLMRRNDRQYRELLAAISARDAVGVGPRRRRSVWRPWLVDRLRVTP